MCIDVVAQRVSAMIPSESKCIFAQRKFQHCAANRTHYHKSFVPWGEPTPPTMGYPSGPNLVSVCHAHQPLCLVTIGRLLVILHGNHHAWRQQMPCYDEGCTLFSSMTTSRWRRESLRFGQAYFIQNSRTSARALDSGGGSKWDLCREGCFADNTRTTFHA